MADENMGYEVVITHDDGSVITLNSEVVDSVEFFVDTLEENVENRSSNIFNKITIVGNITENTTDEVRKVAVWALASKSSDVYRQVDITIRLNEDQVIRRYNLNKAFCLDYKETFFKNDQKSNKFVLLIGQRKEYFGDIKVFS